MDEATQHAGDGGRAGDPVSARIVDDVSAQARAQSSRAADSAQHAAEAARQAAENLRGQEAWMAGLIEQGADRLAGLAQSLRNKDPRTLLSDAEEFARRQPVLFTGAAMILGFALTRAASMMAATAAGTERTPRGGFPHEG
jgi:hypothetical protein